MRGRGLLVARPVAPDEPDDQTRLSPRACLVATVLAGAMLIAGCASQEPAGRVAVAIGSPTTAVAAADLPPADDTAATTTTTAGGSTPPTTAPPDPARRLWGRAFTSVSVEERGQPRPLVPPDERLELAFPDAPGGPARWRISCNTMSASVLAEGEHLVFGDVMGTAAGCEPEREEQDTWFVAFFGSRPRWSLDGDRLHLTAGEVRIVLEAMP